MRKYLYLIFMLLSGVVAVVLSSFSGENLDYPAGAPAGYTGSPFDAKNCVQCHGGSATDVTGWITSNIPAEGYMPGASYTITVTVSGSGKKGFEVSPHDLSGNLMGSLTAGPGNKLVGNAKYVTHSSSPTSNPAIWTFTWTAPAAGTGDVTFYGAFTVSEPVTKLSTLVVSESSAAPMTVSATASPSAIQVGDSSHLDVIATGGSGNYTYTWNSIPAGFVSNEQAPWVKPLETTQYVAIVSDGTQILADTVEVTVFPVGVNSTRNDFTAIAYPNPSEGKFLVRITDPLNDGYKIKIFDINGRFIAEYDCVRDSQTPGVEVDLTAEKPGVYVLQITSGKSNMQVKVVIE